MTHITCKRAIQVIDKNNKRVKGAQPLLTARRLAFERIRTFWASKSGTWLAIDFEAWERDHTLLLEFGWCLVRWKDGEEYTEDGHMIVKERQSFYNHTWVYGNRDVRSSPPICNAFFITSSPFSFILFSLNHCMFYP